MKVGDTVVICRYYEKRRGSTRIYGTVERIVKKEHFGYQFEAYTVRLNNNKIITVSDADCFKTNPLTAEKKDV